MSWPQRSPLPKGAETCRWGRCGPRRRGLNEVRSPEGAETATPSPDPRSRGPRLNEVRSPKERRLGLSGEAEDVAGASTKSAPHRSGDTRPGSTPRGRPSLNEVRSPKERRPHTVPRKRHQSRCLNEVRTQSSGDGHAPNDPSIGFRPQRSPLPKGAETGGSERRHVSLGAASTKSAPQRSGDVHEERAAVPLDASTKSAPQRSGDRAASAWCALSRSWPQRSPLPKGAETVLDPASGSRMLPQRSPLPKGAETVTGSEHGVRVVPASTKSAPQRSGDVGVEVLGHAELDASTKSAPQMSGDCACGFEVLAAVVASTKSAPERSGDTDTHIQTPSGHGMPQRSPLPKGTETSRTRRCP